MLSVSKSEECPVVRTDYPSPSTFHLLGVQFLPFSNVFIWMSLYKEDASGHISQIVSVCVCEASSGMLAACSPSYWYCCCFWATSSLSAYTDFNIMRLKLCCWWQCHTDVCNMHVISLSDLHNSCLFMSVWHSEVTVVMFLLVRFYRVIIKPVSMFFMQPAMHFKISLVDCTVKQSLHKAFNFFGV